MTIRDLCTMVILSCDGVKNVLNRSFIMHKLPLCVRFCLVTEQNPGSCKALYLKSSSLTAEVKKTPKGVSSSLGELFFNASLKLFQRFFSFKIKTLIIFY